MKSSVKYDYLLPVLRANAGQKTSYEIAAETGVSRSYLVTIALKEGISLKLVRNEEKRQQIIEAIKKYGATHTAWQIGKMFNTSASAVKHHAEKEGLKVKQAYVQGSNQYSKKEEAETGFFRVNKYSNWLV